mmetsp:Transcript_22150/g.46748  ORF Transcript_22150/g.46748 Transcript_22150/m.46748 type:complete len:152 (-) Transcript_22150:5-460(-)
MPKVGGQQYPPVPKLVPPMRANNPTGVNALGGALGTTPAAATMAQQLGGPQRSPHSQATSAQAHKHGDQRRRRQQQMEPLSAVAAGMSGTRGNYVIPPEWDQQYPPGWEQYWGQQNPPLVTQQHQVGHLSVILSLMLKDHTKKMSIRSIAR